jgi:anaerobic ribonucleoside-triphosphate reductase activating protein
MPGRIDVLVDGPFVQAERDISLAWRGSRNQRVVDLAKRRGEAPAFGASLLK